MKELEKRIDFEKVLDLAERLDWELHPSTDLSNPRYIANCSAEKGNIKFEMSECNSVLSYDYAYCELNEYCEFNEQNDRRNSLYSKIDTELVSMQVISIEDEKQSDDR